MSSNHRLHNQLGMVEISGYFLPKLIWFSLEDNIYSCEINWLNQIETAELSMMCENLLVGIGKH